MAALFLYIGYPWQYYLPPWYNGGRASARELAQSLPTRPVVPAFNVKAQWGTLLEARLRYLRPGGKWGARSGDR